MLYASGCPWLGDELISFARGTYESDKIILREKKLVVYCLVSFICCYTHIQDRGSLLWKIQVFPKALLKKAVKKLFSIESYDYFCMDFLYSQHND